MSKTVVIGGSSYVLPDVGERSWGQNVTDALLGISATLASAGVGGVSLQNVISSPITVVSGKTYLVDASSSRILNIPAASINAFFSVVITTGANSVTLHRFGSELIDGVAADKVLATHEGFWVFACDGTNWFRISGVKSQMFFPQGNSTLPGLAPSGFPDAGFYVSGYGVGAGLYFTPGSLFGIIFDTTTEFKRQVYFSAIQDAYLSFGDDGTAALPKIRMTGSGIYNDGSGQLAISAGGSKQIGFLTGVTFKSVAGNESTGAGSAALGANSPAVTLGAPYKWLKVQTSDGSTAYIPAWK